MLIKQNKHQLLTIITCSTLPFIRELKIKPIMISYLTPIDMATIKKKKKTNQKITNIGKDAEKFDPLLKMESPYDLAIPPLDLHPKELKAMSGRDICTPMFIVALFTRTKRWKTPKYPLMDE